MLIVLLKLALDNKQSTDIPLSLRLQTFWYSFPFKSLLVNFKIGQRV